MCPNCAKLQAENERLQQEIEDLLRDLAAYQAHDNLHYWLRRKAHDTATATRSD